MLQHLTLTNVYHWNNLISIYHLFAVQMTQLQVSQALPVAADEWSAIPILAFKQAS